MNNQTEREAFNEWWRIGPFNDGHFKARSSKAFQAGAAYQREQVKGLVEALEALIAIAEGRETRGAWMTVDRAREALAAYKAQEGK